MEIEGTGNKIPRLLLVFDLALALTASGGKSYPGLSSQQFYIEQIEKKECLLTFASRAKLNYIMNMN